MILDLPELVGIRQVTLLNYHVFFVFLSYILFFYFYCRSTISALTFLRHQILNLLNYKDFTHTNATLVFWVSLFCFG